MMAHFMTRSASTRAANIVLSLTALLWLVLPTTAAADPLAASRELFSPAPNSKPRLRH